MRLIPSLATLIRDRKGATAVEYGLILALVVLAVMVGIIALGSATKDTWTNVSTKVQAASGG